MSDKRIAPPPEDAECWRCKGTGRITYVRDTLDGPEELTDDCRGCGGTGVIKGAPEVKRGPLSRPEVKR
jgi:DnaJ-class molecular chaperone